MHKLTSAQADANGVELQFESGDELERLYQSWVDHEEWLFRDSVSEPLSLE